MVSEQDMGASPGSHPAGQAQGLGASRIDPARKVSGHVLPPRSTDDEASAILDELDRLQSWCLMQVPCAGAAQAVELVQRTRILIIERCKRNPTSLAFEALEPFAAAANDCIDDEPDGADAWEHPVSMNVTLGDFRRAAIAAGARSAETRSKAQSAGRQSVIAQNEVSNGD